MYYHGSKLKNPMPKQMNKKDPEFKTEYYYVDNEIFVKLIPTKNDKGEMVIAGENDLGSPYNPMRAILNGRKITKKEIEIGAAKRRKEFP